MSCDLQLTSVLVYKIEKPLLELQRQFSDFLLYEKEYEKIKTDKLRREFLASRLALNSLLGCSAQVIYDSSGKPFLKDGNTHISISHAGNYAAVSINRQRETGIDIELKTERFRKLYKRYLSEIEQKELYTDNLLKVQLAWSAKEAVFKVVGGAGGEFVENLRVLPFEAGEKGTMEVIYMPENKKLELNYISAEEYNLVWL